MKVKPNAHIQTLIETPAKFLKDLAKIVEVALQERTHFVTDSKTVRQRDRRAYRRTGKTTCLPTLRGEG